jgi:hypothetical protein
VARLVVRPSGSAHDLPFARAYMHEVDAALAAEQAAHPTVNVRWVGGAYRHNVEDYEGIVSDIGWITAASFVMVLIIIAAAFRSPRALLVIFVPLVVSNVWTLGIAGATVGSLNTFTSFVNAVLIGQRFAAGDQEEGYVPDPWAMVSFSTSFLPRPDVGITAFLDYNDNPIANNGGNLFGPSSYGALELFVKPASAWTLRLFHGGYAQGLRCSGGQCRIVPAFTGTRIAVVGAF